MPSDDDVSAGSLAARGSKEQELVVLSPEKSKPSRPPVLTALRRPEHAPQPDCEQSPGNTSCLNGPGVVATLSAGVIRSAKHSVSSETQYIPPSSNLDSRNITRETPLSDEDGFVWIFVLVVFRRVRYANNKDSEGEGTDNDWDCTVEATYRDKISANKAARKRFWNFASIKNEDDLEAKGCKERYNEEGLYRSRYKSLGRKGRTEEILYQIQESEIFGLEEGTGLPEEQKTLYVMYNEIQLMDEEQSSNVVMGVFASKSWANNVAQKFFENLPGSSRNKYLSYKDRMFVGEKKSRDNSVWNRVFVQGVRLK